LLAFVNAAAALMLVGCVQIASTMNVVAFALALFIVTDHSSGTSPVDVSQSELPTLTVVSVDAVKLPPPVTTVPAGQTATCVTRELAGRAVTADSA